MSLFSNPMSSIFLPGSRETADFKIKVSKAADAPHSNGLTHPGFYFEIWK